MARRKTMTEQMAARSKRAADKQRRGAATSAKLRQMAADGQLSGGEALLIKGIVNALRKPNEQQNKRLLSQYPHLIPKAQELIDATA